MSAQADIPLERFRHRARELRDRGGGVTAAELEQAINDVYAAMISVEAVRTRMRRRLEESMPGVLEPGGRERLVDHAEALRALDQDVGTLREVLRDLRALPVEPARPTG